jgi:hypothetical protein
MSEHQAFYLWLAMSLALFITAGLSVFLGVMLLRYRHKYKVHLERRKQGMLEDLELATSDQLLSELRSRPGCPFLMLSPMHGEDMQGLTIEVHNIPPVPCLSMLHLATALTFRELKSRGVEIPEFPPIDPEAEPPAPE